MRPPSPLPLGFLETRPRSPPYCVRQKRHANRPRRQAPGNVGSCSALAAKSVVVPTIRVSRRCSRRAAWSWEVAQPEHGEGVRDHRLLVGRVDDAHHVVSTLGPPDVLELAAEALADLAPLLEGVPCAPLPEHPVRSSPPVVRRSAYPSSSVRVVATIPPRRRPDGRPSSAGKRQLSVAIAAQRDRVCASRLSVGSPLTWWTSSGTPQRPQSAQQQPCTANTTARGFGSWRPRGRCGRWAAQCGAIRRARRIGSARGCDRERPGGVCVRPPPLAGNAGADATRG